MHIIMERYAELCRGKTQSFAEKILTESALLRETSYCLGVICEPFSQIQKAYGVLSDSERKRLYDASLERVAPPRRIFENITAETLSCGRIEPLSPEQSASSEVFLARSFNTYTPSFDEIFDYLWSNFSGPQRPKSKTRRPLSVDIPISTEQARRGGQVLIMVPAEATCPSCAGRGHVGMWECWRCAGEGSLSGEFPVIVDYHAGIADGHTTMLSLEKLGIRNTYLAVRFRVAGSFDW